MKIPIPTKCFWENFEVSKNIFFQVIETKSLMALYTIMGIVSIYIEYGIRSEYSIRNSFGRIEGVWRYFLDQGE